MNHIRPILAAAVAAFMPHGPEPWIFVRMLYRHDGAPRALWRRQDVLDVTVYQITAGTRGDGPPPDDAIGFQHPGTIARLAGAELHAPELRAVS